MDEVVELQSGDGERFAMKRSATAISGMLSNCLNGKFGLLQVDGMFF